MIIRSIAGMSVSMLWCCSGMTTKTEVDAAAWTDKLLPKANSTSIEIDEAKEQLT